LSEYTPHPDPLPQEQRGMDNRALPPRVRGRYNRAMGRLDRASEWVTSHLLLLINIFLGLFVTLPWLSPLLMAAGLRGPAQLINRIYVAFCHQLPERSYFVFGYQVAHCHRCVAFYGSLFVGGLIYARIRPDLRQRDTHRQISYTGLSIPMAILLCLPILVDALSHTFGLRDAGAALGWLGQDDTIGSLNWWLRLVSGVMAGFAIVFTLWPRVDTSVARTIAYGAYHRNLQNRGA
jgi:uncharacterized membrane protein